MEILKIPEGDKLLKCGWCDTYFFVTKDEGRITGSVNRLGKDKEYHCVSHDMAYSCPKCSNRVDTKWPTEENKK